MRPVERHEILDYVTYNERRESVRAGVMEQKRTRRVHVGEHLTFLFENRSTVRYQIQEMMRAEQIVKEADILREIETYNELLGGPGEIGCTLLIEIDDPKERAKRLAEWIDLPKRVYARLPNGDKIYARFDPRQVGAERLSSVQYLKFDTQGVVPVAMGSDHPHLAGEARLTEEQRASIAQDLVE